MVFSHGVYISDRHCCLASDGFWEDSSIMTYTIIWQRSPSTVEQHPSRVFATFLLIYNLRNIFASPIIVFLCQHFTPELSWVLPTSREAKFRFFTGNNTFDTFPSVFQATWQKCHCMLLGSCFSFGVQRIIRRPVNLRRSQTWDLALKNLRSKSMIQAPFWGCESLSVARISVKKRLTSKIVLLTQLFQGSCI